MLFSMAGAQARKIRKEGTPRDDFRMLVCISIAGYKLVDSPTKLSVICSAILYVLYICSLLLRTLVDRLTLAVNRLGRIYCLVAQTMSHGD